MVDAAANEQYTYRLMRVVKLCIWPPLAMLGNTLLRAGKARRVEVREQWIDPRSAEAAATLMNQ